MLRVLINIVLIFLLIRMLRPIFRMVGRRFRATFDAKREPENLGKDDGDYSELSPYEIEDGEFEEIRKE